jgi:hypothetical protein
MTLPVRIDPGIREYATPSQLKSIDATIELGSARKAAAKLGIQFSHVSRSIKAVQKKAALAGYAPEAGLTHPVPSPFSVKGVSTLYDDAGKLKAQWVKTSVNSQQVEEAVREFVSSMMEEVRGTSPAVKAPAHTLADLLAVYPFGDPHFGMYAWGAEAGEDFDLSIAERINRGAIDRLSDSAPDAETALLLILGDTVHANDQSNQTPAHKHQLDVDSRFPKVIAVVIKTIRYLIIKALQKHKRVIVRIEPGNHDPEAKWAITFALVAYFENNERVTIDTSPSKFWYYHFGMVLIGSTHGDTAKHEVLPGVMAADKAVEWGLTKHRYWYTGHVHTQKVKEFPGVICESFRSLVAKDAYAASHGYRAGRDLYCIVHHKDHGEIERHRCDVAMI